MEGTTPGVVKAEAGQGLPWSGNHEYFGLVGEVGER